jgi:hypothetical protein
MQNVYAARTLPMASCRSFRTGGSKNAVKIVLAMPCVHEQQSNPRRVAEVAIKSPAHRAAFSRHRRQHESCADSAPVAHVRQSHNLSALPGELARGMKPHPT